MAQRDRNDAPGRVHHVMNRGETRRVIFPDDEAKRRYMSLMACSVRRGEMFVQAFSIMDTHFHVVAGTPDGRIGYPFMRINNAYARYANRRYGRDGSPYRGRITTYAITTHQYWCTLVPYTDLNPVTAGICSDPASYRYGSAWRYARERPTPWLDRKDVEERVRSRAGSATYNPADYRRVMGHFTDDQLEIVERRLRRSGKLVDPLDRLFRMPPKRVAAWMRRKARLADGLSPWAPIAGSKAVLNSIAILQVERGDVKTQPKRTKACAWKLMQCGLLHDGSGMGCAEIGRTLGIATSTAANRRMLHRMALGSDLNYALLAGVALCAALDVTYPQGVPR